MRKSFILVSILTVLAIFVWSYFWIWALIFFVLIVPLLAMGI